LQDLAGQGFRKDAWVRMSQAVGSLWIWMKTNEIWKRLENTKKMSLMAVSQPKLFQNGP
jgi:hypothetical protein